ncbi:MAG TPA: hypothetical protein VFJ49_13765 [Methyloceanibacter sp.]|nr:hypothetical protein [Methyloceanibacter sp.]
MSSLGLAAHDSFAAAETANGSRALALAALVGNVSPDLDAV